MEVTEIVDELGVKYNKGNLIKGGKWKQERVKGFDG